MAYLTVNIYKSSIRLAVIAACFLAVTGCGKLSGEGPPYFTTVFQCEQKHSETGWCFATPSRVYSTDYDLVGKGAVQDYIIPGGKLCVANTNGCATVNVEIKDRT